MIAVQVEIEGLQIEILNRPSPKEVQRLIKILNFRNFNLEQF